MNREAGSEETRAVETRPVEHVAFTRSGALGSGSARSLQRGTLALAGLVLLAIVKPWGAPEAPVVVPPARQPVAIASAAPTPRAANRVELLCYDSPSWRVASVGLFAGSRMRELGFVTPVAALGPSDPAIPFVTFGFSQVNSLGYCTPFETPPPADLEVRVFLLDDAGSSRVIAVAREARTPITSTAGLFSLIAPGGGGPLPSSDASSGGAGPAASWPPGRYVFALRGLGFDDAWFGADVHPTLGRPAR